MTFPFSCKISGGQDSIRQKFTGYERDNETNLDFAEARYFGSGLGRFTSADPKPIGNPRTANPQDLNLYVYVSNNPLLYFDPNGEEKIIVYIRTFIPDKEATTPTGRKFEGTIEKQVKVLSDTGPCIELK